MHDSETGLTPKLTRRKTEVELPNEDREQLSQLYTTLSRRSTVVSPDDPSVDPSSDQFDLAKFLKLLRRQLEEEGVTMRQVGLLYKDLNIYGSGEALQIQKTVWDILLAPVRIGKCSVSARKVLSISYEISMVSSTAVNYSSYWVDRGRGVVHSSKPCVVNCILLPWERNQFYTITASHRNK